MQTMVAPKASAVIARWSTKVRQRSWGSWPIAHTRSWALPGMRATWMPVDGHTIWRASLSSMHTLGLATVKSKKSSASIVATCSASKWSRT